MTGQTRIQVHQDAANNVHESRELSQEINHLAQHGFGINLAFSMSNYAEISKGNCSYASH